jgi:hypothetical protein
MPTIVHKGNPDLIKFIRQGEKIPPDWRLMNNQEKQKLDRINEKRRKNHKLD